jgi:3-phosphoshikimate 1-carboxyvinyltransferase
LVSIKVNKSRVSGVIRCPSSKSYTHRAISIASLTEGRSCIKNALLSRDTLATLAATRALGSIIQREEATVYVEGKHRLKVPQNIIDAENSGTTIRIMTAMSALVKTGFTILTGDESLRRRPMEPLLRALNELGVQCYSTKMDGTPPIIVKGGGIRGGTAVLQGTISSQFVSALLISGIYAESDITLKIKGKQVSKPYIQSTLATMKSFGVTIDHQPDLSEYYLGQDSYNAATFEVPSDFSTAALVLSAGILVGDELVIRGLDFSLPQADSKIIEIIEKMGGKLKVDIGKGEVKVYGSESLVGGDFDLSDTPDLLPVVAVLALRSNSPVRIYGISHTRLKETDRIANITSQFIKLGVRIKEQNRDEICIIPPKVLKNASLEAFNDHRLFMAFTIASMLTQKSIVAGAESVDVSYPNFLQDMKRIGARISSMPERE